jgi:recombination protein RecR
MNLPEKLQNSINEFSRIPGVGQKTAFRQIMSLLNWSNQERDQLAQAIAELSEVKNCQKCGMYSDEDICHICQDPRREQAQTICVVENISDLMAIERSGGYNGYYYVLGGVLNPLAGIGPRELKIENLINRVAETNTQTVILAINPSVEGDATCSYIKSLLSDEINTERIGFGVPIGGHLEYLDPMTISKALENRRMFE